MQGGRLALQEICCRFSQIIGWTVGKCNANKFANDPCIIEACRIYFMKYIFKVHSVTFGYGKVATIKKHYAYMVYCVGAGQSIPSISEQSLLKASL